MNKKHIEPLQAGCYWATPHAPFDLEGPNGHDEVFPGSLCVSDGKWVAFFRNGKEIWSCNATYAAAHFDFSAMETNLDASN